MQCWKVGFFCVFYYISIFLLRANSINKPERIKNRSVNRLKSFMTFQKHLVGTLLALFPYLSARKAKTRVLFKSSQQTKNKLFMLLYKLFFTDSLVILSPIFRKCGSFTSFDIPKRIQYLICRVSYTHLCHIFSYKFSRFTAVISL